MASDHRDQGDHSEDSTVGLVAIAGRDPMSSRTIYVPLMHTYVICVSLLHIHMQRKQVEHATK